MNTITYIIPLHEFNAEVKKLLTRALNSVKSLEGGDDCSVLFVGPKAILTKAENLFTSLGMKNTLVKVENTKTDPLSQVNAAVFQCVTPYFSVLEFDDEVTPYWLRAATPWMNAYPGKAMYIPFVEGCNVEGKRLFLCNELGWSPAFVENNLGELTLESVQNFQGWITSGSIISTEAFISSRFLKPSLRLAAWYEFMMRLCYKQESIFVIPKIGYRHTLKREGSYDTTQRALLSNKEALWLIRTAQQEYFFDEDRNLTYSEDDEIDSGTTENVEVTD